MPREDARTKGVRYLAEGRLIVEAVEGDFVLARCRGNGAIYACGHTPRRGWWCDCAAKTHCSHLWALMTVTVRRRNA